MQAEADAAPSSAKKVVVVGAGWGGLGTAHALSKLDDVEVTLIDAAPQPGGLVSGWKTEQGREVEAGIHGFWDEYYNIFSLIDELELPADPLSDYEEQGQYSPKGLEAVWPVYRNEMPLPTGLGQAFFTRFQNLSPIDLASAAPLVAAFSDFDNSPEAWARWDKVSFRDMCRQLLVTERMYKEAFEPMILTGLFAPGEQCSAAAAMGMAYFFVLAHQNSFDVRWCKGSVAQKLFAPWVAQLEASGVTFKPGCRAADLTIQSSIEGRKGKSVCGVKLGDGSTLEADAVVMAVGMQAMQGIIRSSEHLGTIPEFARMNNLGAVDVCAVRLWLDKPTNTPYWSNAAWGFDEGVGMTFFDLKRLHAPEFDDEPGGVIEVDFYHANTILALPDDAIVEKALHHLRSALPALFASVSVLDSAVVRLPKAVSWFAPGSYQNLPPTVSPSVDRLFFAGDYIKTDHGSWSQERAYVTGLEAANQVAAKLNLKGPKAKVIPLKPDEPHVAAGRSAIKAARGILPFSPLTDFIRI